MTSTLTKYTWWHLPQPNILLMTPTSTKWVYKNCMVSIHSFYYTYLLYLYGVNTFFLLYMYLLEFIIYDNDTSKKYVIALWQKDRPAFHYKKLSPNRKWKALKSLAQQVRWTLRWLKYLIFFTYQIMKRKLRTK